MKNEFYQHLRSTHFPWSHHIFWSNSSFSFLSTSCMCSNDNDFTSAVFEINSVYWKIMISCLCHFHSVLRSGLFKSYLYKIRVGPSPTDNFSSCGIVREVVDITWGIIIQDMLHWTSMKHAMSHMKMPHVQEFTSFQISFCYLVLCLDT